MTKPSLDELLRMERRQVQGQQERAAEVGLRDLLMSSTNREDFSKFTGEQARFTGQEVFFHR